VKSEELEIEVNMERKIFRSRISILLIGIILLLCLPGLIPMIRSGNIFNPGFYIIAGVFVFVVLLFCGMRYELTENHLIFKMWGVVGFKIPLSVIISVERSYNLLSSPAGSLKRLKIRMKKGYKYPYALVSPVREQEFLEALKKHNPDIYIRVSDKKGWWRIWDWDV